VTQPRRDHDCGRGARFGGERHDGRHQIRRNRNDDHVRRRRKISEALDRANPVDLGVARIDEMNWTLETSSS
jgi:hypothetical protein